MGIFSSLFNIVTAPVRAVGRAVGKAVEVVGEKTGSLTLESLGMDIQDACAKTSERIGSTSSYDPEVSTVDETANVASILSDFSTDLKEKVAQLEKDAKADVEQCFDQLYGAMEGVLGQEPIVKNLKFQKRMITSSIDGAFNDILARRVSLTDQECLAILKMKQGKAKEAKMEAFGQKVIQEGLDKLCDSLSDSMKELNDDMQAELTDWLAQQRKSLREEYNTLDTLVQKRQEDAEGREKAILFPACKLAASEAALHLLEVEDAT